MFRSLLDHHQAYLPIYSTLLNINQLALHDITEDLNLHQQAAIT